MEGILFNIQRFSVHDGPGIRTTVFFKGCPLRCEWCHNPEGLSSIVQVQYWEDKCIGCGVCVRNCECHQMIEGTHQIDRKACQACGKCIKACPTEALAWCGQKVSVEEVMVEILKDQGFYGKEGGVTCSGGEVLLQSAFLVALLKACQEQNIHTTIDTSGYSKWENLEATLPYCDLYLYDLKAWDSERHYQFTGVHNEKIIENLKRLDATGKRIWIRIPVIEEVNTQDMDQLAAFVATLKNVERITLMPYHVLGKSKYETLGLNYAYQGEKHVNDFEAIKVSFKKLGLKVEE